MDDDGNDNNGVEKLIDFRVILMRVLIFKQFFFCFVLVYFSGKADDLKYLIEDF